MRQQLDNVALQRFEDYKNTNAAKAVINVFEFGGYIYHEFITDEDLRPRLRVIDSGSRYHQDGRDTRKLRLYDMTIAEKQQAVDNGAEVIGTVTAYKQLRQEFNKNQGICCEQMVRMFYGLPDYKLGDNRPYYQEGDVEINGVQYSVKGIGGASLAPYYTIEEAMEIKASRAE